MQKVKVYVSISGDYCAFHEISFRVLFDITNNIQLGYKTLEELENWESEYTDVEIRNAIEVDGVYYVEW
jgi:hypothetical protein